jgi:hypothetical protein
VPNGIQGEEVMKKMVLALGAILLLSSMPLSPSSAETINPDASFFLPEDGRPGLMGVFFNDQETGEKTSHLLDEVKRLNGQIDPTCTSVQDASCQSDNLTFRAITPFCESDSDINCIEEVGAVREDGTRVVGKFKQYFPLKAQNEFIGDASFQLPSGKAGSLVSFPGINHQGGEEYLVTVQISGSVTKSSKKSNIDGFSARIVPVKIIDRKNVSASSCPPDMCDVGWVYHEPIKRWGEIGSGGPVCEATSARTAECAEKRPFPTGIRFYLKTRLNVSLAGWLHGRIADPEVTIESKDGITKISVEALPVRVPILFKSYIWSDAPEVIRQGYDASTGFFKLGNTFGSYRIANSDKETDPMKRNFISTPWPSGKTGIEELKLWLPVVEDKATAAASIWSIRSLRRDETEGANICFDSKSELTGLVTTNATQYSAGPPTLDKVEGTLNYVVAAPHYDPTGKDFKGSYDLVMRSDVARCVYGFSKAPINATLSITSADGTPQIATTLIGERNGWLYLQAKNFEFSAPIIKAKLTQEVVVEPTPTPTATATPTKKPVVVKKTTITCVKGKTSKKVTAVKPKCPTGFKKKA